MCNGSQGVCVLKQHYTSGYGVKKKKLICVLLVIEQNTDRQYRLQHSSFVRTSFSTQIINQAQQEKVAMTTEISEVNYAASSSYLYVYNNPFLFPHVPQNRLHWPLRDTGSNVRARRASWEDQNSFPPTPLPFPHLPPSYHQVIIIYPTCRNVLPNSPI